MGLLAEADRLLARPTASLRELQAFLGKVNFIAGLVVYLRGILSWMWFSLVQLNPSSV